MLKVLIVDDEAVVRRGIVLGIDWASLGCAVVGEAANGEEGLAAAERYSPCLFHVLRRFPYVAIHYLTCHSINPFFGRLVVSHHHRANAFSRNVSLCVLMPFLQEQHHYSLVFSFHYTAASEACELYPVRLAAGLEFVVETQGLRT